MSQLCFVFLFFLFVCFHKSSKGKLVSVDVAPELIGLGWAIARSIGDDMENTIPVVIFMGDRS